MSNQALVEQISATPVAQWKVTASGSNNEFRTGNIWLKVSASGGLYDHIHTRLSVNGFHIPLSETEQSELYRMASRVMRDYARRMADPTPRQPPRPPQSEVDDDPQSKWSAFRDWLFG